MPLVVHGGARVEDLVDRFVAGDTLADIAEDFGVPEPEVEDVVRVATRAAAGRTPGTARERRAQMIARSSSSSSTAAWAAGILLRRSGISASRSTRWRRSTASG